LTNLQSSLLNRDNESRMLSDTKKSLKEDSVTNKPSFKISEPIVKTSNYVGEAKLGLNRPNTATKVDRLLKEVDPNQAEEQKKNVSQAF
jgi:hypothetical protein